jgi:hypothetical protein
VVLVWSAAAWCMGCPTHEKNDEGIRMWRNQRNNRRGTYSDVRNGYECCYGVMERPETHLWRPHSSCCQNLVWSTELTCQNSRNPKTRQNNTLRVSQSNLKAVISIWRRRFKMPVLRKI